MNLNNVVLAHMAKATRVTFQCVGRNEKQVESKQLMYKDTNQKLCFVLFPSIILITSYIWLQVKLESMFFAEYHVLI